MLKVTKKYILAFPPEKEKALSNLLEKEGCLEIISHNREELKEEKAEIEKSLQDTDYFISSLSFAISYLKPFTKKIPFLENIKNPKISIKREELKNYRENEKISGLVEKVVKIEKNLVLLSKEKKEGEQKLEELKKFENLEFIPKETEYTFSLIISFVKVQVAKFKESITKHNFYIQEIAEVNGRVFLLLIGIKDKKQNILDLAEKFKVEVVPFNFSHPPLKEKEIILSDLKRIEKQVETFNNDLFKLADSVKALKIYHDFLIIQKTNLDIKKRSFSSNILNYLSFWGQEVHKKKIEQKLSKISSEITIIETQSDEGEETPVVLENNKIIRPFEYVTEIFGLPRSDEIDPTPYLSLFFIIFFGICITDAGYGLLLMLFTALPLIFLKKRFAGNKLLKLLFYGGISAVIAGILFGSYFGIEVHSLKIPFLEKLKMLDPIEDTLLFMIIAFLLGYLQIFFAQIVKIISGIKNKKREMILNGVSWSVFYLFLGIFVLGIVKISPLKNIGLLGIVITGCFLIMFVESKKQKLFLKPLIGGIILIQRLINIVSDVLSYSRLMALGLATTVIALIINQIALLFGSMIPYVGWLITVLILIGGHIFNLSISVLGAFIHSGRLQFVEFFPKFLEGGGRRFKPTKSNLKYIEFI